MDEPLKLLLLVIVLCGVGYYFIAVLFDLGNRKTVEHENNTIKVNRKEFLVALHAYELDRDNVDLHNTYRAKADTYSRSLLSPQNESTSDLLMLTYRHDLSFGYIEILELLRKYPTNSILHQMALAFGRKNYSYERKDQTPTIYDENAIANDIRAATGAHLVTASQPVIPQPSAPATPIQQKSASERLEALANLKASGHITEAEYEQKRKDIIDSL